MTCPVQSIPGVCSEPRLQWHHMMSGDVTWHSTGEQYHYVHFFKIKFCWILRNLTDVDFLVSATFSYTSCVGLQPSVRSWELGHSLSKTDEWRMLTSNMSFQRNGKPSSLRRKEESFWITKPSWWRTCSLGSTVPLLGILWNRTHLTSRILSFVPYYTLKLVSVRMKGFAMCALCNEKKIVLIQNVCVWVCGCMCMCVHVSLCVSVSLCVC